MKFKNEVSKTLMGSLYSRAKDEYDDLSVLACDYIRKNELASGGYYKHAVQRTEIMDREVTKLIEQFPDATYVNVGCGMCTRFYRLDNGRLKWIEVDFPDVGEARRAVLPNEQSKRHYFAGKDLNSESIDDLKADFVIAEGCLMYLEPRAANAIICYYDGIYEVCGSNRKDFPGKWKWKYNWETMDLNVIAKYPFWHDTSDHWVMRIEHGKLGNKKS